MEEKSAKFFLDALLPRILPQSIGFLTIPHDGKQDLRRSIPRKLKAWQYPDDRFIIVHDQDSNDCRSLKTELQFLCLSSGRADVKIRIACRELEAWYLGDLSSLDSIYGTQLQLQKDSRLFRSPDATVNPSQELSRLIPTFSKTDAARRLGQIIDLENNRSSSFRLLLHTVTMLLSPAPKQQV
ncbi:MAG: DUF4276 family protein [Zwartia sp.]